MIKFQPKEGSVLYCDYEGFKAPEMIKKRPVVVVKKHRLNPNLVVVVPISTTETKPMPTYHIEMDGEFCGLHLKSKKSWIKCDMINIVSIERLHLIRGKDGKRYIADFPKEVTDKVKECVQEFLKR